MRKLADGTLIFPKRGKPPPLPVGYEYAEGDKFVMIPVLQDCKHREHKPPEGVNNSCCPKHGTMFCHHYGKTVIKINCLECEVVKWE